MTITWRDATKGDIPALQQFTCTDPPERLASLRPKPHPRPHEDEVQRWLHTCRPPGGPDDLMRVGIDDAGNLVAVSVSCRLSQPPDLTYKILALAVGCSHRNAGGEVADACLTDALQVMEDSARELGAAEAFVFAWVHVKNVASQQMCERNGFVLVRDVNGDLGEWVRIIAVDTSAPSTDPSVVPT